MRCQRAQPLHITYKLNGYVTTAFLWCVSGLKASLDYVWNKERFYTAGPVPQKGTDGLVDQKPWVSIP